jgi:hypothetical protein
MRLRISTDLGITYPYEQISDKIEVLKKLALDLEKRGEVRWVIVDDNDEPIHWCQYIEATLKVPSDSMIATDDPYVQKLAKQKGVKFMTSLEMFKKLGIPDAEAKLANFNIDKVNVSDAWVHMKKLVDEKIIQMVSSGIDETKIGKELFGHE